MHTQKPWSSEFRRVLTKWIALLALTAAMPALLLASESAAGRPRHQGSAASRPVAPWNSPNPITRATWGTYVSLGDSFSAGEGLPPFQAGTVYGEFTSNNCHRSTTQAYSNHLAPKFARGGPALWACSGATTLSIYDSATQDPGLDCTRTKTGKDFSEPCQVSHLTTNTSLVTLMIGGDDINFVPDLINCYTSTEAGCRAQDSGIRAAVKNMLPHVTTDLQQIRKRSPHARIIVLSYPRFFARNPTSERNTCAVVSHFYCLAPGKQAYLNQAIGRFDVVLCGQVLRSGVGAECVNGYDAFDGCEISTDNHCVTSPVEVADARPGNLFHNADSASYHPSARGQLRLAHLFDEQIYHPPHACPKVLIGC